MTPPGLLPEGRYRLDSLIAAGGMGEVWRATDQVLERPVAVKLLKQEYARDTEASARFRAEARHAGLLSHPNIAQVFDYSEDAEGGRSYLVMELVHGPSLATLLADGPVGSPYAMAVTAQVAAGLAAAHAAGLVHRDIKPGNLLISKDGLVKITDFGIAHAAGAAPVTRTGEVIGTAAYLAPERAEGAPAGPPADLYALGMVAYECLTGKRPFTGEPLAVALAHQLQPLPPLPPDVPESVAGLVTDLTAKDPAARPASAAEVAARAEQLRTDLAGTSSARAGLPLLAGAIVNTGPQEALQAVEPAAPPAGHADEQEDATPRVAGLAPAAGGGAAGEAGPARRRGPFGWIGRRTGAGVAAAVLALTGLAAWILAGLHGYSSHGRMSARTHPAARPAHSSPASVPPADLTPAPAAAPVSQPTSPAPSQPSAPPARTQTQTPTQAPTQAPTPAPTRSSAPPSPTPTPTRHGADATGSSSSDPSGAT